MSGSVFAAQTPFPADSFRHEAFLYSGDEHFVAGTTTFVRDALDAGQAVLVAVVGPRTALLRRALGRDAGRVEFLDMAAAGRNPAGPSTTARAGGCCAPMTKTRFPRR